MKLTGKHKSEEQVSVSEHKEDTRTVKIRTKITSKCQDHDRHIERKEEEKVGVKEKVSEEENIIEEASNLTSEEKRGND